MKLLKGVLTSKLQEGTCITIGKFDGVHKGHRLLIEKCIDMAKEAGLKSCLFTFDTVPSSVTGADYKILTLKREKELIFESLGLDIVVEYLFDTSFKNLLPEEFIKEILIDKLNMKALFVGSDFRFGKNNLGNIDLLKELSKLYNFKLDVLSKEEEENVEISSSTIKKELSEGRIDKVNKMLGYEYIISGKTKSGKKLGRTIGVPTMNIYPEESKSLPAFGVYAGMASFRGREYKCVINVGVRPTVNNSDMVSVETHLLDYNAEETETYGEDFSVRLFYRIREEIRFDSVNKLFNQIEKDIEEAKILLAN